MRVAQHNDDESDDAMLCFNRKIVVCDLFFIFCFARRVSNFGGSLEHLIKF